MAEFWSNPKQSKLEKPKKKYRYTKPSTPKKECDYIGRVKQLSCSCCGKSAPSSAHHIREGQGSSQKAQNWLVVSLCYECHQGCFGVHGDRSMLRIMKMTELDLLAETIRMLNEIKE